MTAARQRNDKSYQNHFLDWIREQPALDSWNGYRVYDLDGLVWDFKTRKLMLLETKTHGRRIHHMREHQKFTLEFLYRALIKGDEMEFVGTFLITFENTSPADGYTMVTQFNGVNWIEYKAKFDEKTFIGWLTYMLRGEVK